VKRKFKKNPCRNSLASIKIASEEDI